MSNKNSYAQPTRLPRFHSMDDRLDHCSRDCPRRLCPDAHRPEPPYEYWRDALSWMRLEKYIPYHGGWYYVRVGEYVCKAYYDRGKAGFYDGGEKISAVTVVIREKQ